MKIVMLGDSITEGMNWNEFLGRNDISNQGIGEDTTEGFLNRLEFVYQVNPELCFIMGGVNDLGKNVPVNVVVDNIEKIVRALDEHGIKAIIQSTLFVSKKWVFWKKRNKDIMELNQRLKKYCIENNVLYVDINQFVSKDGILKEEYTIDGVHLQKSGYEKWKELIVRIIQ
jgi:lysophospholipase L1-like esterase